jgi:hypothetical protein
MAQKKKEVLIEILAHGFSSACVIIVIHRKKLLMVLTSSPQYDVIPTEERRTCLYVFPLSWRFPQNKIELYHEVAT